MLKSPNLVGSLEQAPSSIISSCCLRYSISSATDAILRSCSLANCKRSGKRAISPSSFVISQITAASCKPANRQRSIDASV